MIAMKISSYPFIFKEGDVASYKVLTFIDILLTEIRFRI
jgi:hypothetical protein